MKRSLLQRLTTAITLFLFLFATIAVEPAMLFAQTEGKPNVEQEQAGKAKAEDDGEEPVKKEANEDEKQKATSASPVRKPISLPTDIKPATLEAEETPTQNEKEKQPTADKPEKMEVKQRPEAKEKTTGEKAKEIMHHINREKYSETSGFDVDYAPSGETVKQSVDTGKTPWYKSWILWTSVGVAAFVGVMLGLQYGLPEPKDKMKIKVERRGQ